MTIVSHRASRPVAVLGTLALALMHGAVSPAHAEVFDAGHVDAFYVTAPGGELTLSMKEDITGSGVVHSGDDVTLKVAEEAWNEATEGIDGIGIPTYYLPQTQDTALLWPGWDTQPAQSAGYKDVDFEFVEVTGPGDIFVFETAGFGDIQPVTEEGAMDLVSGDVINQAYPAHRHVNWAFTDPGIYTMTVQAVSNGDVSNQVTYTWDVGDADTATLESDEEANTEAVELASDGGDDAALGDAPRSSDSHTFPHSDTDTAPAAAAGSAPAAKAKDTANANTAANRANKPTQNRKENSASTDPRDRKDRRSPRNTTSAASADDVDTVVASGYYDSGQGLLPWGIGILGLGMLVLGLAIARLALLKGRD